MIEVRYAGAVVGRSAIVRELDTQGLFLGITEPMPVGTMVTLKVGDRVVQAKVAAVAESQELARAGMRVRFADPAAAALFGTPAQAAEPAAPIEVLPPPRPAVPPPVPPEASRSSSPEPDAAQASAPRRIVVDASTESAAVTEEAEAGSSVATAVPASEPAAAGEGGPKKNRRNKRR